MSSNTYPSLPYTLLKKEKTTEKVLEECKSIIKIYKDKAKIVGLSSKIIKEDIQSEALKAWISPIHSLKAVLLLYTFDMNYPEVMKSGGLFSNPNFEIKKAVKDFHDVCDGKCSILVLCKSKTQIFGGYTPLSFKRNDSYGKDNKSFLFSINDLEKYHKKNFR